MKKSRGIIVILILALFIGLVSYVAIEGIGSTHSGSAKNINLGLDLAGGVSITYEAKDKNPTKEEMSDTIYKLQKRVDVYSTESEVYQEGSNRINVDIPGVTDANKILEELGKPGSIEFQTEDGVTILTGADIKNAEALINQNNMGNKEYVVSLTLTEEAAKRFEKVTGENIGKSIPIIYDNEVISAPTVQAAISGGNPYITNMESYEEATELASTIRIGSLQLELTELRSNIVGAKLGQEAISTSVKAGIIGIGLIIVFMIGFYLLPGLASGIGLILYAGLTFILLNAFNITLTLPGIAGTVLSIGMAVDANVVIFARIREEIATGKTVYSAIKLGFEKAFSAIMDGNVSTLIIAAVLGIMGSGTIKGFAQTLALGCLLSMFTALFITRLLLYAFYAVGLKNPKLYGVQKERATINFLDRRKLMFAVPVIIVMVGIVFLGINKSNSGSILNYSMEFRGGTSTNVTFPEDMTIDEIDTQVKPVISKVIGETEIQAQKVEGSNEIIIKTRSLTLDEREKLNKALTDNFDVDESLITAESISSTIGFEMRRDAVIAVIISIIGMMLYIWFRFKDIWFAVSAMLELFNDVLIVFAFYAITGIPVGGTFIACMLTVIGYSINSTVVVFDRIRENKAGMKKSDSLKEMVNASITQTLSRSINTNMTSFIAITVLYIMGVVAIREFALPLMVGIVYGTFSSIFITAVIWYLFENRTVEKKNK